VSATLIVTLAATGIGLAADLGASGPVLIAAAALAVGTAAIVYLRPRGEPLVVEVLAVVLVSVVLGLAAEVRRLEGERTEAVEAAKRKKPSTFTFVVVKGEPDPADTYDTDSDYAYERVLPQEDTVLAPDGQHGKGEQVEVTCAAQENPEKPIDWYRLEDGNFIPAALVQQSIYNDRSPPPRCGFQANGSPIGTE